MEVHLTPELEAKLADGAARQGRPPDEFVRDLIAPYFARSPGSLRR